MKKRKLTLWIVVCCLCLICIKIPVSIMAAPDDVYYKKNINYGSYWNPIFVDGYYCELYHPKTIYATECKGKVLEFPTVIPYNHKYHKITTISEKFSQSEDDMYGYFPGYTNKDSVEKIMIPNGIKKVDLLSLHTWKNLKEFHIPQSVVGKHLYLSHTKGKIVIDKKNKKYKTSGTGVYTKDTKKLRATFGRKKTFTIKKGTKCVEWEAFLGYEDLKKVIVPSSVNSMNLTAFQGCENLKSIVFQGDKAPSFGKKINLQFDFANDSDSNILENMPKKVIVYVKNKSVKKSIEKIFKIADFKILKWKVKVKK